MSLIQPADIVVFGPEPWYRWSRNPNLIVLRLIQIFSTDIRELLRGEISEAVHVELVTRGGERLQDCWAVGARADGVKERRLWASQNYCVVRWHGDGHLRRPGLRDARRRVVSAARDMVGLRYGYVRLLIHALDQAVSLWGLLPWRPFARAFRGGHWEGRECSNVVAYAYREAGVLFRGKHPSEVTPDDIDDEVTRSTDWWLITGAGSIWED